MINCNEWQRLQATSASLTRSHEALQAIQVGHRVTVNGFLEQDAIVHPLSFPMWVDMELLSMQYQDRRGVVTIFGDHVIYGLRSSSCLQNHTGTTTTWQGQSLNVSPPIWTWLRHVFSHTVWDMCMTQLQPNLAAYTTPPLSTCEKTTIKTLCPHTQMHPPSTVRE